MKLVRDIITDLRERHLWPVAILLLAALVAVPVVFAKSSSSPVAVAVNPAAGLPSAPALPVVNAQSTTTHSKLTGASRDPFGGSASSASASSSTKGSSSAGGSGSGSGSSGGTLSSGGGATSTLSPTFPSGGGSAPTSVSTPPAPIVPTLSPPPVAPALTGTESYSVSLAITNTSGGINTMDPLERLSVLPDNSQPQLVELGVLSGGHSVLFAVEPGTVVNGPGTCTPGPIDCEILAIAPDQTEGISTQSASGGVTSVAQFAVTAITVDHHSSAAAALAARSEESAVGRELLDSSQLGALSLFRYEPDLGYVVDLRNLTIGG